MTIDFFGNGLCIHCNLAKNELREFIGFHAKSETAWEINDQTLQNKLKDILLKYPEDHHDDFVESYSWDLHLNQIKYPNIHRESILLTIYSFFENKLNRLCEILSESVDSKMNLKDLRGKGIDRALLYLEKVADLDLSGMGKEKSYIKNVNLIRNLIVHNGAIIPDNPDSKVLAFITDNSHLYGKAGESIIIRSEFIDEFLRILIGFFEKLEKEIQKYISEFDA